MAHHLDLALAAVAFAAPLVGQAVNPYGTATPGLGGSQPRAWVAGEPRLGSQGFYVTVDRATGGAASSLLVGTDPASLPVAGIELLVDPAGTALVLLPAVTLSGALGLGGVGQAQVRLPIPAAPALVELSLFGQWLILDSAAPQGLAASDGVHFTLRDAPLFVGSTGSALEVITAAGQSMTVPWSSPTASGGGAVVLSRDGTTAVCLVSDQGQVPFVEFFDLTTQPPTLIGRGTEAQCIEMHRSGVAYILERTYSGIPSIATMVVDRSDPQFGRVTTVLPNLGGAIPIFGGAGFALSPDGNTLVHWATGGDLMVVDIEVGSPTQYQTTATFPSPIGGPNCVFLAPGATSGFLVTSDVVTEIDLSNGQVLDQVSFASDIRSVAMDPRGRFLALALQTANAIAVIDLEPGPGRYTVSQFSASAPNDLSLAADGSSILAATANGYEVFDLSGAVIRSAASTAPGGSRTVELR